MNLRRVEPSSMLGPAAAFACAASLLLAFLYFRHVPMSPDGGWYAYPSFAWSVGGDPSENLAGFDWVRNVNDRVVAMFGWENRSNLTVPVMGQWFRLLPASPSSIAALGVLQWLAIAGLAALVVFLATRDRLMSVAAGLVTLTDSRLIAEAIADARPDVPVLVVAMALLASLIVLLRRPDSMAALLPAVALAVALPLVHVTAANAIAMLATFLALAALAAWIEGASLAQIARIMAPAAAMLAAFLLRQPILDVLVPTGVPANLELVGQHSLVQKVRDIIAGGLERKAAMEMWRWSHQFHPANFAHLLFLLAGLAVAAWRIRAIRVDQAARQSAFLFGGLLVGIAVMFAVDPHHTSGHAMVLAVIAYAAAAIALAALRRTLAVDRVLVAAVVVAIAVAGALKLVHSGIVYVRYAQNGISTAQLTANVEAAIAAVEATAGEARPVRILGASEIWPYLTHRRQRLEITDPDRYTFPGKAPGSPEAGAQLLIVTDDHYKAGWAVVLERWKSSGLVTQLSTLGTCNVTSRCMEIYRISELRPGKAAAGVD